MRSVFRILLALSISFGTVSLVQAHDQLVMPFDCGLERGRVKISPAAERRYAIVGEREKQAITTCNGPQGCRTLTVHRFVISCGGAGVAWMRVAAAIKHSADAPAWIESDRLHLVLPASDSIGARPACLETPEFALGRTAQPQRVALVQTCPSDAGRDAYEHVVLPAGFAPVTELGARLVVAVPDSVPAGPRPESRTRNAAPLTAVSASVGETLVAKIDSDAIVEPIPGLEPYDPADDAPPAGADWVTVVRTDHDYGRQTRSPAGGAPGPWAWLLAALAFATGAGLVGTRFAHADSAIPSRYAFAGLGRSSSIRKFTNAGATVAALLEQTATIVSGLKGAGPLREVLQSELKVVRQRLENAEMAAAEEGRDATAKSGPQFRALVRDLDRIRRIARSAAASLSGSRQPATLPRTVSEAYDVLGVNADVREEVLKKIVDALRMSWHPDHARDDEDRRVREDRIRQINIAWELVNAKRDAA